MKVIKNKENKRKKKTMKVKKTALSAFIFHILFPIVVNSERLPHISKSNFI